MEGSSNPAIPVPWPTSIAPPLTSSLVADLVCAGLQQTTMLSGGAVANLEPAGAQPSAAWLAAGRPGRWRYRVPGPDGGSAQPNLMAPGSRARTAAACRRWR